MAGRAALMVGGIVVAATALAITTYQRSGEPEPQLPTNVPEAEVAPLAERPPTSASEVDAMAELEPAKDPALAAGPEPDAPPEPLAEPIATADLAEPPSIAPPLSVVEAPSVAARRDGPPPVAPNDLDDVDNEPVSPGRGPAPPVPEPEATAPVRVPTPPEPASPYLEPAAVAEIAPEIEAEPPEVAAATVDDEVAGAVEGPTLAPVPADRRAATVLETPSALDAMAVAPQREAEPLAPPMATPPTTDAAAAAPEHPALRRLVLFGLDEGPAELRPLVEVHFDLGSARLTPGAIAKLERAARVLREVPADRVMVVGNTDTTGPASLNMRISAARAGAVRDFLIAAGLPAVAIETVAQGQERPPVATADGVSEPLNRCVGIFPVDQPDA
jgi:outer membrane protein OmpA-like peptidoglycan-associated protein